jgi:ribosomal protein L11 methyltransferase
MNQATAQQNPWFGVRISCDSIVEEAISNFLFEIGAQGLVQQDEAVLGYFSGTYDPKEIKGTLQRYLAELSELHSNMTTNKISVFKIPNCDWNAEWKKHLKPIVISKTIAIKPNWIKTSEPLAENVIEIDPEMAFGTGIHATTRLILRLMEGYCYRGCKVLDVGTGTGILAIAAAKLGASKILALDNDPIAVTTAKDNCRKNRVTNRVNLITGTIDAVQPIGFDLILANLNCSEIIRILSAILGQANTSAVIVLSGILTNEENLIRSEVCRFGLRVSDIQYQNEWLALVAKKL